MEIGSNFDLNINDLSIKKDNIFNYLSEYNCCYFDSGRSAIKAIKLPKGKILLPNYICDSVIDCFNKDDVIFYKVDDKFQIDFDDLKENIKGVKTIFIMHYFGCVQPKSVLNKIKNLAKEKSILIIEDTTHSILSTKSTIGDYMICSIRKWLPITRGGVLYTKRNIKGIDKKYKVDTDNRQLYGMILKNNYLNGLVKSKKEFLNIFGECEKNIDIKKDILLMSDLSRFIASCFSINEIKKKRINNYKILNSKLKYKPINRIKKNDCPFVCLIRIDTRDKFRKYLIKNNIYCPIHWPNCSINEISIPIDNRYDLEEMNYIIDVVNNY